MPNQNSNVAVFEELALWTSLMSESIMFNIIGCQSEWVVQQSDAQQAYAQSELKGTEAWFFLPCGQWNQERHAKSKQPDVRLCLAPNGRPLTAASWEMHCADTSKSLGFEPTKKWELSFVHHVAVLVWRVC